MCGSLTISAGSVVGCILALCDAPRDISNIAVSYTFLLCGWYSPYIALWILNRIRR
jgi:hypothetical protein